MNMYVTLFGRLVVRFLDTFYGIVDVDNVVVVVVIVVVFVVVVNATLKNFTIRNVNFCNIC